MLTLHCPGQQQQLRAISCSLSFLPIKFHFYAAIGELIVLLPTHTKKAKLLLPPVLTSLQFNPFYDAMNDRKFSIFAFQNTSASPR